MQPTQAVSRVLCRMLLLREREGETERDGERERERDRERGRKRERTIETEKERRREREREKKRIFLNTNTANVSTLPPRQYLSRGAKGEGMCPAGKGFTGTQQMQGGDNLMGVKTFEVKKAQAKARIWP